MNDTTSTPTTSQRIVELADKGLHQKAIAQQLGVSRQYVFQVARKCGIEFAKRPPHKVVVERIERLKAECVGMTVAEAARHLGVSASVVRSDRDRCGFDGLVTTNSRRPRSERTNRILERAPALAAAGLSKSDAAREIGVAPTELTHAMRRYAPDVKWRDGREDGRGGRRKT